MVFKGKDGKNILFWKHRKLILFMHNIVSLLTIIIITTTMILFLLQVPCTSQAAWKALTLRLPQRHL